MIDNLNVNMMKENKITMEQVLKEVGGLFNVTIKSYDKQIRQQHKRIKIAKDNTNITDKDKENGLLGISERLIDLMGKRSKLLKLMDSI